MTTGHQVEFANLILHSGKYELLDVFDSLLWPALVSEEKRKFGTTLFFIESAQKLLLEWDGKAEPVVAGRFIKAIKLHREQYFKEGEGLIADRETLDSAPSGLFVLTLRDHKLIYLHETNHAPPLKQLETTLEWLVVSRHYDTIRQRHREHLEAGSRITYAQLRAENPNPTLDIVPLSVNRSISEFIESFDRLTSIQTRLLKPNSEIDLNPFFEDIREEGKLLGAEKTVITQHNREGLNSEQVKKYVHAAAAQGNSVVELKGVDDNGNRLKGDNHKFSIKRYLPHLPSAFAQCVAALFSEFKSLVASGEIPTAKRIPDDNRLLSVSKDFGERVPVANRSANGQ